MADNVVPMQQSPTDQFRHQAEHLGKDLRELGATAKGAAQEQFQQSRKLAEDFADSIENKIGEHPIRSVVIALGIGLLAGLLFGRRD